MKKLILLAALVAAVAPVYSQGGGTDRLRSRLGAPSASLCSTTAHVGKVQARNDGKNLYTCLPDGLGGFAWFDSVTGGGGGLADPGGNGVVVRTALDTTVNRTITGTANEVTVTNGDGVAGNPTLSLDADIGALGANGTNGLWARTGAGTGSARTLTGTANQVTVTNGDGVAGNPTISVPAGAITLSRPGGITTVVAGWPSGTHYLAEDFVASGAVCSVTDANQRQCGTTMTFWLTGTGCSMAANFPTASANHPGQRTIRTGTTGGNACEFQTTAASLSTVWTNNFDLIFIVNPEHSDTSTKNRFGLTPDIGTDPPTTGVYFEKQHAGDAGGNDTNWFFVCGDGTRNRTDTTIAHAASTYFTARIRRVDATNIAWSMCSGDGCTLPAETTTNTNCPTAATEARIGFFSETNTTSTRGIGFDFVDWLITGIVR